MWRKLAPLAIFILIAAFLGIGLTLDPTKIPSPLIDKPVPDFTLPLLKDSHNTVSSAEFRDEVTLLNVWASWCVACRMEHPLLLDLARSGEARIYGLNYKDRRDDALKWLDYYGDPYYKSAYDHEGKAGIDFGVYGVPETFIIDKNGIVRYKHIGPVGREDLDEKILPLIARLKSGEPEE